MTDLDADLEIHPQVRSVDLSVSAKTRLIGWQTALARAPRIRTTGVEWKTDRPGVVSVPIRGVGLRTSGFLFSESGGAELFKENAPTEPIGKKVTPPQARRTRIASPIDIVKLEDRLYYLLQPPLESLLSNGSLQFPFEPFPYQLDGVAFLYPRTHAILADEMGLGKTMQAITTIRLLLHAREARRVLLVCPKPLVTNWQREFALWAPEIPLSVISGDRVRRHWQWQRPEAVVTLANYEILLRDRDVLAEGGLHYDLAVLDEAQRIKNRSSSTSQAVRAVSRSRSWALTGTPIENSLEDLVGIFEFLAPGHLRSEMKPRTMRSAVSDHILRRTKDQVLTDLPPKLFRDAHVELTPEQQETYTGAEEDGVVRLNELGQGLTIQHVFELILRLKQICNFDPVTGASAKMERLAADLEECAASGQKAIVFSQWVQTLSQIKERLAHLNPLEYHGQIPSKRRDGVIDQFKKDSTSNVILMSYGAGSVGLNLQFCNYVFLFDRWWNPAVEDQAINRAHRIGTEGPVTVSRFLTLGTIEERIDQILEEKRELFDTILGDAEDPRSTGMTREEIFGLFRLQSPKGPIDLAA